MSNSTGRSGSNKLLQPEGVTECKIDILSIRQIFYSLGDNPHFGFGGLVVQ